MLWYLTHYSVLALEDVSSKTQLRFFLCGVGRHENKNKQVWSEFLTALSTKMVVSWVVVQCWTAEVH
jgi:hypothetical protein